MAASTCMKCGSRLFELVELLPAGAANKLQLLQCASCGTPVGIHDGQDNSATLTKLTVAVAQLKAQVAEIDAGLHRVVEFLNRN